MLILAIQSANPTIEIALLDGEKILFEKTWASERDEISKLLPAIADAFETAKQKLSDLKKIVVVNGPGGFSSTRIGVTIANTLSYALQAELYQLDQNSYDELAKDKPSETVTSLATVISKFLKSGAQPVVQATPLYSAEAKITPSKKPKFV